METPEQNRPRPEKATGRRRRWLKAVVFVFGLLAAMVVAAMLILQTDWARERIKTLAEDEVAGLLQNAELRIGSIGGSILWNVSARDIRLYAGDSLVVAVDEAEADYNLLALLSGTLDLGSVRLARPHIIARQRPDSTWDLLEILPVADPDTTSEPLKILVDRAAVTDGSGQVRFATGRDSLVSVDSVNATARNLEYGRAAAIDSFLVHAIGSGSVLIDPVRLVARGSFGQAGFSCDQCAMTSPRSFLGVDGFVDFAPDSAPAGADLTITADSLSLADVRPFAPFLNGAETVSGSIDLNGPVDSLGLRANLAWSQSSVLVNGLMLTKDSVALDLDADLNQVDPSSLWTDSPVYGTLNANLSAHLSGPEMDQLDGSARLRTSESRLNDVSVRGSDLRIAMEDGIGTVSGVVAVPGVEVDLAGQFTPFRDTLYWDVDGAIRGADLGRLYSDLNGLESFSLRYRAEGNTASPADYFQNLDVDIGELRYQDFLVDSTTLRFDRTPTGVASAGAGRLVSATTGSLVATLSLTGDIRFADDIVFHTDGLRFDDLDVGFGTGPDALSRFSGRVTGDVVIPQEGGFTSQFGLEAAGKVLTMQNLSLSGTGEVRGEDLDLNALVHQGPSSLTVSGNIQPFGDMIGIAVEGRLANVDLSAVAADSSLRSDLSGDYRLDGTWQSAQTNRLQFAIELDESSWNDQFIDEALIRLSTENGVYGLDARGETPRGGLQVEGRAAWSSDTLAVHALDGSFTRIDIGNFLGLDRLETELNGEVHLEPDVEGISAVLALRRSRINRSYVDSGDFHVSYLSDTLTVDGTARLGPGRLEFAGDFQSDSTGTFLQAVANIDSLDVSALTGIDTVASTVNAGCSMSGRVGSMASTSVSALCLAENSRFGDISLTSARLEGRLDLEVLEIDSLTVVSNIVDIDGSGTAWFGGRRPSDLPRDRSDLKVSVEIKDLSPLARPLGLSHLEGEGTIDFSITGRPSHPSILVEPHLAFLTYDDVRVASIDGYVETDGLEMTDVQAVVDVGFSVIAGYPIQQTSISLLGDPESFIFTADILQREGRRGNISAQYLRSLDTPELHVDDLTLNLAGTVWRLNQEATIQFGETWEVRHLLIAHDDGQIAIDGYVNLDGDQNLVLTAESVETSSFIDLFGISNVSGALEGFLILEGPADALVSQASFRVRDLAAYGEPAGDLNVEMEYSEGRLHLNGHVMDVSGDYAEISGSVPVNLTLGGEGTVQEQDPLDVSVAADSMEIDWILPFLDESLVSDLGGLLHSNFSIGGSWDDPVLTGSGTISAGRVELPDFQTTITDVNSRFTLSGNDLQIDSLAARTGQGSISGTGVVNVESLSNLGLDLDVQFQNFRAIATETYRFTISGTADVTGSMLEPVVEADVRLGPGDVFLTDELTEDELETVRLTDRDLRILERRFGYQVAAEDTTTSDFVDALRLTAKVDIGRDVWLRSASNPAMDIEFSGDLDVRKNPFEDYRIIGRINVNPARSRIIQFARRFGVDQGTITFNGPLEDAVIEFRAEYIVPSRFGGDEVRILLTLSGLLDDLQLNISSEPQMDDATIASYLLTGRPPDKAAVAGEQAAEIAIGGVSRMVEAFANENFGLDVVEIESSGADGAQFTVGKYISPTTYVYVRQPINIENSVNSTNGNRGTQVGLEYELYSWLISEISSRSGNFRLNLRWQISY